MVPCRVTRRGERRKARAPWTLWRRPSGRQPNGPIFLTIRYPFCFLFRHSSWGYIPGPSQARRANQRGQGTWTEVELVSEEAMVLARCPPGFPALKASWPWWSSVWCVCTMASGHASLERVRGYIWSWRLGSCCLCRNPNSGTWELSSASHTCPHAHLSGLEAWVLWLV